MSKSITVEVLSTREEWHIFTETHTYVYLRFRAFDIGCRKGDTVFEVVHSETEKQEICNTNKLTAYAGLKSNHNVLAITFSFTRKPSTLIEGFEARYSQTNKPDITPGLLSEEDIGMPCYWYVYLN